MNEQAEEESAATSRCRLSENRPAAHGMLPLARCGDHLDPMQMHSLS
jgi:hypothetical protein